MSIKHSIKKIMAEEIEPQKIEGLKLLVDANAYKLATNLYKQFVSEEDFSKFPQFIVELDAFLIGYRGQDPIEDKEVEEFNDDLQEDITDEIKHNPGNPTQMTAAKMVASSLIRNLKQKGLRDA